MKEEKKELFSQRIVAGRRTYFFDVRETQDGTRYLVISESRLVDGEYKHDRIMIFQEHIPAFIEGLKRTLKFMKRMDKVKAYDIEEIRKKYPRAYMKWTKEEDETLRDEYLRGKTIGELAKIFQRKPSAIHSRLRKLGLLK